MKKSIKISGAILVGLALVLVLSSALSAWHPWQRQPMVFYYSEAFRPVFQNFEVVDGDIIVMEDGSHIVIEGNRTINSIECKGNETIVNSTRHISLWELLTGGGD